MDISRIKSSARVKLGAGLFAPQWIVAVVICVIFGAIEGIVGSCTVGVVTLLAAGPLSYGLSAAFLRQSREGKMEITDLFAGVKSEVLTQNVILGILLTLFVTLWSFLLVIPGIVKGYAWSMAFYLRVDHPDWDWRRCLDESAAMMDGHKAELFVMDLSFIGWYILGSLACGIGTLWVVPYHNMSHAEYYRALSAC